MPVTNLHGRAAVWGFPLQLLSETCGSLNEHSVLSALRMGLDGTSAGCAGAGVPILTGWLTPQGQYPDSLLTQQLSKDSSG